MKFVVFILCLGAWACGNPKEQKAELVLKNNPIFERYAPKLEVESKYLLIDLADEIKSDVRLENGDWHYTIDIPNREGAYFHVLDMVIYLRPGSKLYVEHNERNRFLSVFQGDTEEENRWLNQRLLREPNLLRKYDFKQKQISFLDYKDEIDGLADSLLADLKSKKWNKIIVDDLIMRLDFVKAHAYCLYVRNEIDGMRYALNFQDEASFEDWKAEQLAIVKEDIWKNAFDILRKYSEDEIVNRKQGIDALLCLETIEDDGIKLLGFTRFQELYDYYATKLYDPTFAYSLELKDCMNQVRDQRLRSALQELYDKNSYLLEGAEVRDFEFEDVDGEIHRLSEFEGMPIYIDVWATWCNPCIALSPYFEKLSQEYEGKNIKFVAISIDKNEAAWRKYLEKSDHENVVEWRCTSQAFLETYQIAGIPRFILIDKDFRIKTVFAPRPNLQEEVQVMLDGLIR